MERKLGGLGHGTHEHQQAEQHRNEPRQTVMGDGCLHAGGHAVEVKSCLAARNRSRMPSNRPGSPNLSG